MAFFSSTNEDFLSRSDSDSPERVDRLPRLEWRSKDGINWLESFFRTAFLREECGGVRLAAFADILTSTSLKILNSQVLSIIIMQ